MKKVILVILMGLSLISCSLGAGIGIGRHGVNGHVGIRF